METGVNICYDGPDRAKYFPDALYAENLKWLVDQGFQKQILLSMDAALMDAGVPMKKPETGIAMGLITDKGCDKYAVLSDILGDEDHLGDMDFKVTGTRDDRPSDNIRSVFDHYFSY